MQDNQHAHSCRIEAGVAVFNMLMTIDWAGSIDQSNAQQFDSDYQELRDKVWFLCWEWHLRDQTLTAKNMMWFFAGSIQWRMVGKRDRQVVNMLSFVMKIMKKSLYSPPSMFISVRRLWNSIMTCRLKIWVWKRWIF